MRLLDVAQLCVYGNVQVTSQLVHELLDRQIPVCYFTYGGWFYRVTQGMGHKNVELRRHQYRASENEERSLAGRPIRRGQNQELPYASAPERPGSAG